MQEYDLIADWYATERTDRTGVPEVLALGASLPTASLVLDAGCGNGIPVTRALLNAGLRVIGIDTSSRMLERFQRNCPGTPAIRTAVQTCPFADGTFDACIAWGVIFHLPISEQLRAIASVARVLRVGAPFLFTSGDEDGTNDEAVGVMNGVKFHYYSFSAEEYRRQLAAQGLTLETTHADEGKNFYYLARKVA